MGDEKSVPVLATAEDRCDLARRLPKVLCTAEVFQGRSDAVTYRLISSLSRTATTATCSGPRSSITSSRSRCLTKRRSPSAPLPQAFVECGSSEKNLATPAKPPHFASSLASGLRCRRSCAAWAEPPAAAGGHAGGETTGGASTQAARRGPVPLAA